MPADNSAARHVSNRALAAGLLLIAPVAYAIVALLLGKKTGWDHFNYHWYNAYAWLHDRFHVDVAVAHHATYYNPLSDLPLYLLATNGPAWWGGAFMGAMAGITVGLIGIIAHGALPAAPEKQTLFRTAFIALIAALGTTGAGAFQEIGDPANDIPAAIGIFSSIATLIFWLRNRTDTHDASKWRTPLLAGVLAGVSVALKLTTAVYAVGIVGALLFTIGSFRTRFNAAFACGAGVLLGMLVVGGFWMHQLWSFSGNPLFPYFNDAFHSPMLRAENYRDLNFRPDSWFSALIFPWQFTLDSRTVSESVFRDARILILYASLPSTLLVRALFTSTPKSPLADTSKFLFAFAAISYLAWLAVFDIYRYLIPLEMLAPLLVAVALSTWPIRAPLQFVMGACMLLIAQLLVRVDLSDRQSWSGPYVEVTPPRVLANNTTNNTMILMTGHAPMAYVVPFFPSAIPFVRIDSWLVSGDDTTSGLARIMRKRVAGHTGSFFVLFEDEEVELAKQATRHYGLELTLSGESCESVRSNINAPLWLCRAQRTSEQPVLSAIR